MRITGARTFAVEGGWSNWLFIKLLTDDGLHGWGEATHFGLPRTQREAVHELAGLLVGRDPRRVEENTALLRRLDFGGASAIVSTVISGLEMAMWDILGKSLDAPVHVLLGGACRERVRVYGNGWHDKAMTLDDYARAAEAMVARGYDALKWDPFLSWRVLEPADADFAVECVRLVREAVGPGGDLCVEAHARFTPASAIAIGRRLAPFTPLFFEEPVPPDNLAAFRKVAEAHIGIPLAAGEQHLTRQGCRALIESQAVDVLQPDVMHTGGLLEARKIAAMFETAYLPVAPHNPYGPVSVAASLHLAACVPNLLILESCWVDCPWRDDLAREPLERVVDGTVAIPAGPGLGIELDEDALARHPAVEHKSASLAGATADWSRRPRGGAWRGPDRPGTNRE